jgi:hypothetical protein
MDAVTAEQCKEIVREAKMTWLGHHRCGGCGSWVGWRFEHKDNIHPFWQEELGVTESDIIAMFDPRCDCNGRGSPEPRSWDNFAHGFNMQSTTEIRERMWERFKAGKATHEDD